MARKPKQKRYQNSRRRPVKDNFWQSKTWENIGNFFAWSAFGVSFFGGVHPFVCCLLWFVVGGILVTALPGLDRSRRQKKADDAYQLELLKDPRKTFLVGVEDHLRTLEKTSRKLPQAIGKQVEILYRRATDILNDVDADIAKSIPIVPFFTTHLPNAARLAVQRVRLNDRAASELKAEIDQALEALTHEFAAAQTAMMGAELASLDVEMRLLSDAMEQEIRT